MTVSKIQITDNNQKSILNYLAINHPTYRILREDEYEVSRNGQRYGTDRELLSSKGKTVRIQLEEGGLAIELPIELLSKPNTSVIPVYITESEVLNLEEIFDAAKKEKVSYAQPEKVLSFENFEIRGGQIVPRRKGANLMYGENVIIIKS